MESRTAQRRASLIDEVGDWFVDSGIQFPNGGVSRYLVRNNFEYKPISTEITGYSITTFLYLHRLSGDPRFLSSAGRAARFLTRTAWDPKHLGFPVECDELRHSPYQFFFDSGIIVRALVDAWKHTGEPELLSVASACGHAMARDFAAGASVEPVVRLVDKRACEKGAHWSTQPGCYQLKAATAWLSLASVIRADGLRDSYNSMLQDFLPTHEQFLEQNSLEAEAAMGRLHAYCYFLEGLLPVAARDDCAGVIRRGIALVERECARHSAEFLRSDVLAQLLRLRLCAHLLGVCKLDARRAHDEAAQIAQFVARGDCRCCGGFYFGARRKSVVHHVNPVSTAFSLQALVMWYDWIEGIDPPMTLFI